MTARPNSKRDRGFEKLAARLEAMHGQPEFRGANAFATDFHGANPAQLRRLYIHRYAPEFSEAAELSGGQDLVNVFREAWEAAHKPRRSRPREGRPILVRIPEQIIAAIDAEAAERGESRAAVVRRRLADVYGG